MNYEQALSRAAASSEDRITQDAAGEEAQGMQLSRRCWDVGTPISGCLSWGTIAAKLRWVFPALRGTVLLVPGLWPTGAAPKLLSAPGTAQHPP